MPTVRTHRYLYESEMYVNNLGTSGAPPPIYRLSETIRIAEKFTIDSASEKMSSGLREVVETRFWGVILAD
jgi:hypothetical protein